jgi:hypothetical protein
VGLKNKAEDDKEKSDPIASNTVAKATAEKKEDTGERYCITLTLDNSVVFIDAVELKEIVEIKLDTP